MPCKACALSLYVYVPTVGHGGIIHRVKVDLFTVVYKKNVFLGEEGLGEREERGVGSALNEEPRKITVYKVLSL